MTARARRDALAWLLASVLLLLFLWRVAIPATTAMTHGFSAYYTSARLVRDGADPARFYDDDWFFEQTKRVVSTRAGDIYNTNTPVTALLFWPLVGFTPDTARLLWTGLNLLFLGLALVLTLRATRGDLLAGAIGLALLALSQPVADQVHLGQAYALVLLGEAVVLWAYLSGRDTLAGTVLGLLLVVKSAGLLLPLLLLGQRRWRALCWMVATIAGV